MGCHHGRLRAVGCHRPRRDHRCRPAGIWPGRPEPVAGRAHRDGFSLAQLSGLRGPPVKFPADLTEPRDGMCPPHHKQAGAVIRRRIARAEASNRAGWRMLGDASARLSLPHLPGGLATRLAAAEKDLTGRARLLAEAAAGFAGRPDDFGSALAENRDEAGRFPGWLTTRGRRSPRTPNAGPMTSGPGYSPVTRWPSSAMPKRRSPISRWPCRWPSGRRCPRVRPECHYDMAWWRT